MTLLWVRANAILGGKHVHGYRHPTDDRYFIWAKRNRHDGSMRYIMYFKGMRVGEAVDLPSAKHALEAHKAEITMEYLEVKHD